MKTHIVPVERMRQAILSVRGLKVMLDRDLAMLYGKEAKFMKVLTRSNRFYDTSRFGQPEIRVYHRKGKGKRCPRYLLRCGCCQEKLEIHYADDGMEIGGVNGAIEDWREILLPLLCIEQEKGKSRDRMQRKKVPETPSSRRRGRRG